MDWVCSGFILTSMFLIGKKKWYGWLVSLTGQICWFYLLISRELYGLMPAATILTILYAWNLRQWYIQAHIDRNTPSRGIESTQALHSSR